MTHPAARTPEAEEMASQRNRRWAEPFGSLNLAVSAVAKLNRTDRAALSQGWREPAKARKL